ncbi:MAG: hypothetical protein PHU24_08980 [Sphaerochaetaceae bacterium]|nr:hypothetical protein [Sphaerochaetaceae bacterium]NLO59843.1 hypothetical protein [Spirochaetales bacterium]MDD2406575.1 hypothetical protein [Sphaerochaetaceae bacterium]MDD4260209.1 hypothetical protein [Sphaerochaetaceae bacterium]MDD4762731.1 hypothetical protein [Sphaerochaetaceae bacterium]
MLQIIGRKSCRETQKALRYCKERRLEFQFVDLRERELSDGELNRICKCVDPLELVDTGGAYYIKEGYAYRDFEPIEEIQSHPELIKTPILRQGDNSVIGFDEHWINLRGTFR